MLKRVALVVVLFLCGVLVFINIIGVAQAKETTIKIYIRNYIPGSIPEEVGEPLKMARVVADEYEALHPGVKIEFVEVPGDTRAWTITQQLGEIAPELIWQQAEYTWEDVGKEWWVNLDPYLEKPNPYVEGNKRWIDIFISAERFNARRAPNGHMYIIPLDQVETIIFYNKDIFEEVGVDVPKTWKEFMDIQAKLKKAGYATFGLQAYRALDWVADMLLTMLYDEIKDELDLDASGYLEPKEVCRAIKQGYLAPNNPRHREVWKLLGEWRSYWQENLDISSDDLLRQFVTKKVAMVWDGSWSVRRLTLDPLLDFRWGTFYFPKLTKEDSSFAIGVNPPGVGGATCEQLAISAKTVRKKDNLEEVIDFLMFVTSPQNVGRIVNEGGMFIPNVKDVTILPELEVFQEILDYKYCLVRLYRSGLGGEFQDKYKRLVPVYLDNEISLDEFMQKFGDILNEAADELIAQEGWEF